MKLFFFFSLLASSLTAADSSPLMEACSIEVKTHCGTVEKKEKPITKCLHDHKSDLSHNCQEKMAGQANRSEKTSLLKQASPSDKAAELFKLQGN